MKRDEIISLLANRINQPHVIETYLKKVEITAYKKGVKDSLSGAMSWIKVTERLPEDEAEVLACFIGWDDLEFIRVLEYDKPFNEWTDWQGDEYKTVICWQPLPALPKP